MPDIDSIRDQLKLYPGSKLGFVIYRLTYSDDEQWARFMHHLNTRVRVDLEAAGNGDVFPYVDWDVQEDPALDGADHDTVRERFATYISQHPGVEDSFPRSLACMAVTQGRVDFVLRDPRPEKFRSVKDGFVDLVALDPEGGSQTVGLSFVFPRVYSLITGCGWEHICVGEDEVFAE